MITKYRAWLKNDKKMIEVSFIDYDTKLIGLNIDLEVIIFDFDDVILMQSTGLKSDLEEELFEGDIILWTYWNEFEDEVRAEIVFENGMFKLLDTLTRKEVWDNLFDCIENCNVYLVGNIYQNPEFLEADHDRD